MQAMIFCAGLGTRFKPWTNKHPKALAIINGKSLLQRNIEYLQRYGINDVIVNAHHFADQIIEAINLNKGWGSKVTISDERAFILETGGGLLNAKPLFKKDQSFITCNADVLTDLNIDELLQCHQEKAPMISLAVSNRHTSRSLLFDNKNQLCGWRNKTTGEERIAVVQDHFIPMAYDCIAVFEYDIFEHIKLSDKFSLIDLYLDLAKTRKILGYQHNTPRWIDVGNSKSKITAMNMFNGE